VLDGGHLVEKVENSSRSVVQKSELAYEDQRQKSAIEWLFHAGRSSRDGSEHAGL
jgi:hypothetical protein